MTVSSYCASPCCRKGEKVETLPQVHDLSGFEGHEVVTLEGTVG